MPTYPFVYLPALLLNILHSHPFLTVPPYSTAHFHRRDLLHVLEQRDASAMTLANQSTELEKLRDELIQVESRRMRLSRENVGLASEMLRLAERSNHPSSETDPAAAGDHRGAEIARLGTQVRASRRRWRIVKGTASAIVAGSGVDWARDPELTDIVLDPENEDDI